MKDKPILPHEYVVCMYVRLSLEDEDLQENQSKDESGSITAQRQLIKDYLRNRKEFSECRVIERCDDGFSGTHFDTRPGFMEMIELAKHRKVNCIIVKDFSRFGRNYVELGDYLEQLFPFLGVRFISVNDGYDSADLRDGETGGLDVAFKNIIYDYYSRDLSKKAKLAKRQLALSGKYSASYPLYGYRKSSRDKHKLVVVPEEAKIVREVYDMKLSGMNNTDIARNLNERKIEPPAARLVRQEMMSSFEGRTEGFIWTTGEILHILQNEEYTGTLVAQKHICREIGGRIEKAPKEHWVKVEGTHEAIVSKDEYAIVQKMIRTLVQTKPKRRIIYKCGLCGRTMEGRSRTGSMRCTAGRVGLKEECKTVRIRNDAADEAILYTIKQKIQVLLDEAGTENIEGAIGTLGVTEQIASIISTIKSGKAAWMRMYDEYSDGKINREEYIAFKKRYDTETRELEDRLKVLKEKQEAQVLKKESAPHEKYREILEATELTQEIEEAFVDKVKVYEGGRLEIHLKIDDKI